MHSLNAGYSPGVFPTPDSQHGFLDNWANQMAISEASRRLSRGPSVHRHSMRITKPASTHNSPREQMTPSKRRSAYIDNQAYRRLDPHQRLYYGVDAPSRPARPVSWHPSSYFPHQNYDMSQQASCYPVTTLPAYTDHNDADSAYPQVSPIVPSSYSASGSPCPSLSMPMGGQVNGAPQYLSPDSWSMPPSTTPYYQQADGTHNVNEPPPPSLMHAPHQGTPAEGSLDWNPPSMQSMGSTTPSTPESLAPPQQQSQPVAPREVPYEPMQDQEEDGEVLVGMGLYDTTDKVEQDPQLDNYRSTVTSLLGSTYRPQEPTGKGLTLEEAWEPPKSDDGEEADDSDAPAE